MGLLDTLLQNAPEMAGQLTKNPQLVKAALGLLSSSPNSVGGSGGLGGLITAFQQKGLGDMVSAWISTGPNPPVSAGQVTDVLGADVIGQFAKQAGVPETEAAPSLAAMLPALVDHLTPNGQVPQAGALEGALGSLLRRLG